MVNTITWILIADASKARIFSMHKAKLFSNQQPNQLELLHQFTHDKSRLKDADLASDRMGEFGKGTFTETSSPKELESQEFAHELIIHLQNAKQNNLFRDLIIVAPPTFMGILHKHMSHEMQKNVIQHIEKDYTQLNGVELVSKLLTHF